MTTLRHPGRQQYLVVDRGAAVDTHLSFRARGVLMYLLAKPDDWHVRSDSIAAESPNEGRDAVRSALAELRDAGYLVYRTRRDEHGRFTKTVDVYEQARCDETPGRTEDGLPVVGSPGVGSPGPLTSNGPSSGPKTIRDPISSDAREEPIEQRELFVVSPVPVPPVPKKSRKPNPLWDAICSECTIDGSALTASQRHDLGKTVRELTEVGATPAQIVSAAREWRQRYNPTPLTHRALRNHWAALVTVRPRMPEPWEAQDRENRRVTELLMGASTPNGDTS